MSAVPPPRDEQPASPKEALAAAEPVQRRVDPRPRMIDGTTPWNAVYGKRKDRRYQWANKTGTQSVEYYSFLGYTVEKAVLDSEGRAAPGHVHLAGRTARHGEPIEMMGLVLMSIDEAAWLELERYGADGQSGQDSADAREKSIIRRTDREDLMRGIRSKRGTPYFRLENETQPETIE